MPRRKTASPSRSAPLLIAGVALVVSALGLLSLLLLLASRALVVQELPGAPVPAGTTANAAPTVDSVTISLNPYGEPAPSLPLQSTPYHVFAHGSVSDADGCADIASVVGQLCDATGACAGSGASAMGDGGNACDGPADTTVDYQLLFPFGGRTAGGGWVEATVSAADVAGATGSATSAPVPIGT